LFVKINLKKLKKKKKKKEEEKRNGQKTDIAIIIIPRGADSFQHFARYSPLFVFFDKNRKLRQG